jgi:predicted MFS family arabinose efflux permease
MIRMWLSGSTFGALGNTGFRWYWLGRLTSLASYQMYLVAQGWLVYELTGSALSLGWVSSSRSIAMLLFSLYGGVICDRFEKRDILVWVRLARAVVHLGVAMLISVEAIRVWHLVASSLLAGVFLGLIMPAEQAIVSELVDRRTLLNAVSLNSIATGFMAMLAASAAGFLIERTGMAVAYYIVVAFHLLTLFVVAQLPTTGRSTSRSQSIWSDLQEGLRYLLHSPVLSALMGLVFSIVLFARPYNTFMPKFAREVMGFGATGFGLLAAAPGAGSLVSSLAVASLGDFRRKGKLLLASGMSLGVSLFLFVNVGALLLPVILFLALVGATTNICVVIQRTLLQAHAGDQFRGRVMGVYIMMAGLAPLGVLPAGTVADRLGVPFVVTLQGLLLGLIFLGMMVLRPEIRRLE